MKTDKKLALDLESLRTLTELEADKVDGAVLYTDNNVSICRSRCNTRVCP